MLQTFQQQPVKPESNCHLPVHLIQTQVPNVTASRNMVAPQPAPQPEPSQQKTAFDKVVQGLLYFMRLKKIKSCLLYIHRCFQKLLDRFDYDDEPEVGEETKKDEITSQPTL